MLDDETLEAAAVRIEAEAGNSLYVKAWKRAARMVRDMKKLTGNSKELNDKLEQISSSSGLGR